MLGHRGWVRGDKRGMSGCIGLGVGGGIRVSLLNVMGVGLCVLARSEG